MKKKTLIAASCLLFASFALVSCTSTKNTQDLTPSKSGSSSIVTNPHKQAVKGSGEKIVSQDLTSVSDLSQLKTPDKIIFYHGGKQKVFTKKDTEFATIVKLNNQRKIVISGPNESNLDVFSLYLPLGDIFKSDNVLEYNYDESKYFPIYFPLSKLLDGKYYFVAQQLSVHAFAPEIYGGLSAPDKLLDYLIKLMGPF